MAKAKEKLFSGETKSQENIKNKQIIQRLIEDLKKRLQKPEEAQKAALILEQWINESSDQKQKKDQDKQKKSA